MEGGAGKTRILFLLFFESMHVHLVIPLIQLQMCFVSKNTCCHCCFQEAEERIGPVIIRGLGLATQRETTVVWSKVSEGFADCRGGDEQASCIPAQAWVPWKD